MTFPKISPGMSKSLLPAFVIAYETAADCPLLFVSHITKSMSQMLSSVKSRMLSAGTSGSQLARGEGIAGASGTPFSSMLMIQQAMK
jgi:hypothetical protein